MDKEHLRTGDKTACRFRFIKNPEYVELGTKMIFREGRTKAVGTITKLHHEVEGKSTYNTRSSKQYKSQMHQRAHTAKRRTPAATTTPQQNPTQPAQQWKIYFRVEWSM